jgi:hypothetical protein
MDWNEVDRDIVLSLWWIALVSSSVGLFSGDDLDVFLLVKSVKNCSIMAPFSRKVKEWVRKKEALFVLPVPLYSFLNSMSTDRAGDVKISSRPRFVR